MFWWFCKGNKLLAWALHHGYMTLPESFSILTLTLHQLKAWALCQCQVKTFGCNKARFQSLTGPTQPLKLWAWGSKRKHIIQSCTGTATQPPCQHRDDQWFRSVCTHCHLLLALAFFGLSMHVNSSTFVARASSVVCNLKARCKGTATHCKKTMCQH